MAGGIDFHDVFMYRRGFIQIPRHLLYWLALALKALTGVNAYNCFWLMARRSASRRSTS
jgi:hypothetical protein